MEAVLSLEPSKIREGGDRTGHKVMLEDDVDVLLGAAQIILFYIPNAPKEKKEKAMDILGLSILKGSGFW